MYIVLKLDKLKTTTKESLITSKPQQANAYNHISHQVIITNPTAHIKSAREETSNSIIIICHSIDWSIQSYNYVPIVLY